MPKRIVAAVAASLLAVAGALSVPPAAAAASGGLSGTGTTSYELLPDRGVVHVTVKLTLKNNEPDTLSAPFPCAAGTCRKRTHYVFNAATIPIEAGAASLKATSDAGRVGSSVADRGDAYDLVKFSYPNLSFGKTRRLTIDYDVPGGKPRSDSPTRIGKAFSSFCFIAHGFDGGSVTATIPAGFQVTFTAGPPLAPSPAAGKVVYSSGPLADPGKFLSCLEATNTTALAATTVNAAGHDFSVRAWPGDAHWADMISADVRADIPRLETLFGLPLPPSSGPIVVQEAAALQLGDYSGEYNSQQATAQVSEDAGPSTVAHELSHIWFNNALFTPVWLNEGFAGYAEQTAGQGNFTACTEPGPYPGAGSPDLANWQRLDANSTKQDEAVLGYQYAAACYVVTSVADSIGPQRLRDVLASASKGLIAYRGSGPAESTGSTQVGSRQWLDLVDELGMVPAGSADLDATQNLLARYGILTDRAELAARSAARSQYHALATAAGTWGLPIAIREPMAAWRFAEAVSTMDTGRQIVADRDRIRSLVSGATLDGTSLQQRFSSAGSADDLAALLTDANSLAAAAQRVGAARSALAAPRGPVEALGLLGTNLQATLDRAEAATTAGDAADASSASAAIDATLAGASNAGLLRLGIAAAVVLALLLVLVVVWLVRRRRDSHSEPLVAAGPAGIMAGRPVAEGTQTFDIIAPAPIEDTPPPADDGSPPKPEG